jgi:peptide/nickel transport system permease protein
VAHRLLNAVPLLLAISLLIFLLLHAVPGGPLEIYLSNPNVRPEDIERLRRALGLDQPLWRQYLLWLSAFVRGDWGYSFADGRPVAERVLERLPATLELTVTSLVAAVLIAVPVGMCAAVERGRWFDRATNALAFAGISLPPFWFGLMLQIVFAIQLGWLPSSGRTTLGADGVTDRLQHLVLPATVLALLFAAGWSRYLRASMIDALAQPFVRAARARGAPSRLVLFNHALRNALAPVVTVILLDTALIVSGAVVTESVFAWPGLGSLFTEALARRDYTVLMALLMLTSTAVVLLNIVADLLYARLDPRVGS